MPAFWSGRSIIFVRMVLVSSLIPLKGVPAVVPPPPPAGAGPPLLFLPPVMVTVWPLAFVQVAVDGEFEPRSPAPAPAPAPPFGKPVAAPGPTGCGVEGSGWPGNRAL